MKKIIYVGLLCIVSFKVRAIDDLHFFRAEPFFGEPRFEKPWLSSVDITAASGATEHARTDCNRKTCLLNIYGPHNMQQLGQGVPKTTTDPLDIILTNLAQLPAQNCFGQLLYKGRFSVVEATFSYIQNLTRGFFAGIFIPVYSIQINNVCFTDCSSVDQASAAQWQAFLNAFDAILSKYNLYAGPIKKRGLSDTVVYAGWTINYQDTKVLDYVDFTIKAGGLVPTGKKKDENSAFDLSIGYNGHPGVIVCTAGSVGIYDWLTFGGYMEALVFFPKCRELRMKTDINQNGFIKLAKGAAKIDKGTLWQMGAYTRADHLARGFSFLIGYSFAQQNRDHIAPCDQTIFNQAIVNSDAMFKGWSMHTLHFGADYDFTKETMRVGPRLGFFYDRQIAGHRTFDANMNGGTLGLDVVINF